MPLPQDPFMLYSMINMKLRYQYPLLDELCAAEDIDRADNEKRLADAGFEYDPSVNQFR